MNSPQAVPGDSPFDSLLADFRKLSVVDQTTIFTAIAGSETLLPVPDTFRDIEPTLSQRMILEVLRNGAKVVVKETAIGAIRAIIRVDYLTSEEGQVIENPLPSSITEDLCQALAQFVKLEPDATEASRIAAVDAVVELLPTVELGLNQYEIECGRKLMSMSSEALVQRGVQIVATQMPLPEKDYLSLARVAFDQSHQEDIRLEALGALIEADECKIPVEKIMELASHTDSYGKLFALQIIQGDVLGIDTNCYELATEDLASLRDGKFEVLKDSEVEEDEVEEGFEVDPTISIALTSNCRVQLLLACELGVKEPGEAVVFRDYYEKLQAHQDPEVARAAAEVMNELWK